MIKTESIYNFDPDYRREPKTDCFCVICQKDIKNEPAGFIHVVGGGVDVLAVESEAEYAEMGCRPDDTGFFPVGPECAKRLKGYVHKAGA